MLDVGVHLTLTELRPVAEAVSSLVGADGAIAHKATFARSSTRKSRRVREHGVEPTRLIGYRDV